MAEFITCKITKAVARPCNDRQGGIAKLWLFAYVKYSKSLNLVGDQKVITFPTTNAYQYEAQNIQFSEATSLQNGGVEWTQKLSFTITESNELSEVYKLANQDYSAVVLDRNGKYRFIGMRNGGEVSVNASSGSTIGEMNGYNISITAKEDNQAYYIPDFESIFNVVSPFRFESPSAARNLSYSGFMGDSINLNWDASTQGTLPLAGYYVYNNNALFATVQTNSISIDSLEPSSMYSFYVRAFDTEGNYSIATNKIGVTTDSATTPYSSRVFYDGGIMESLECVTV